MLPVEKTLGLENLLTFSKIFEADNYISDFNEM